MKTISTQRPPVLSDCYWAIYVSVSSTTVKHLCIKTTCPKWLLLDYLSVSSTMGKHLCIKTTCPKWLLLDYLSVSSTIRKHLCIYIKTTCLLRPPSTGPLGGLYRQVALYNLWLENWTARMCYDDQLWNTFLLHYTITTPKWYVCPYICTVRTIILQQVYKHTHTHTTHTHTHTHTHTTHTHKTHTHTHTHTHT